MARVVEYYVEGMEWERRGSGDKVAGVGRSRGNVRGKGRGTGTGTRRRRSRG